MTVKFLSLAPIAESDLMESGSLNDDKRIRVKITKKRGDMEELRDLFENMKEGGLSEYLLATSQQQQEA